MRASLLPTRVAHQSVRQLPTLCSNSCTWQRRIEQNSAHRPLSGLDTSRSGTGHVRQFLPQAQAVAVDERSEPSGEPVKNAEELVAAALRRADQAMQVAEKQIDRLHKLPSAQEPRKVQPWEVGLRVAAAAAALLASQSLGPVWQVVGAAAAGAALGVMGHQKGSLSASGAAAAAVVGTATLAASMRCGATLLAFYYASSQLTAYKEQKKAVEENFKPGGQRDWVQVFCNAGVPAILAVAAAVFTRARDAPIGLAGRPAAACLGGVLGYFACCCGDTWASELGQLSEAKPRLITTLQPVRTGTNGGVTALGLAASLAGGLFVGVVFYAAALVSPTLLLLHGQAAAAARQWQLIPLGLVGGLAGSLVDSLLGATVQFSGFNSATQKLTGRPGPKVHRISGHPLLSNNGVNLVSASATAALVAWLTLLLLDPASGAAFWRLSQGFSP